MDNPKTTRDTNRRSKLCLKSMLATREHDPIANVVTVPRSKEATVPPEAVDDLHDFKSPTKPASKPKKMVKRQQRMPDKPYNYPPDCTCTQDMFAAEWMRASLKQTDYLSENEFEIYKDKKKREALLQSKAKFRNKLISVKIEENPIHRAEKLNSSKAKPTPLEPVLPGMNGCSVESGEEKTSDKILSQEMTNADNSVTSPPIQLHTHFLPPNGIATSSFKNKSTHLRSELRNIKIENIIIPDSDPSDDEVPCSQLISSKKLKTSTNTPLNQNGKFKSAEDLKSVEKILCTTESASFKPKLASSSMPLNILPSYQLEDKKANNENVNMVALPTVDKSTKNEVQFKKDLTPNLQNAKMHPVLYTYPSTKLPLPLSVVHSTEPEWRAEKLSIAFKPSRTYPKTYYIKKFRFSLVRSLRWKKRMLRRKQIFYFIKFLDSFGMWN